MLHVNLWKDFWWLWIKFCACHGLGARLSAYCTWARTVFSNASVGRWGSGISVFMQVYIGYAKLSKDVFLFCLLCTNDCWLLSKQLCSQASAQVLSLAVLYHTASNGNLGRSLGVRLRVSILLFCGYRSSSVKLYFSYLCVHVHVHARSGGLCWSPTGNLVTYACDNHTLSLTNLGTAKSLVEGLKLNLNHKNQTMW